ncbi:MAG: hypothetical protein M1831_007588 [Alyxoria varia]|nr:MAG: hypothetical protein M1831_007588 [Alyxoria varia]
MVAIRDSLLKETWTGDFTAAVVIVTLCSGLAIYNALEIIVLIFTTFKKWSGLYYWSLLVSSIAVIVYSTGYTIQFYELNDHNAGDVINNLGWIVMVTGQAVVLWSRLHLVLHNQKTLRIVLYIIIADTFIFYIPTTTTHFVSVSRNDTSSDSVAYSVIEKIQMTGFCAQEFLLSGLYVREILRLLRSVAQQNTRRTMWQLFAVNIIIIALDVALLMMEYLSQRVLEKTFKGLIYSIKLKMEFAVLSKLVSMVRYAGRVYVNDEEHMFYNGKPQEEQQGPHSSRHCTYGSKEPKAVSQLNKSQSKALSSNPVDGDGITSSPQSSPSELLEMSPATQHHGMRTIPSIVPEDNSRIGSHSSFAYNSQTTI